MFLPILLPSLKSIESDPFDSIDLRLCPFYRKAVRCLLESIKLNFNTYLEFVCTCIIMTFIPGPGMAYLLTISIAQGRKFGIISILGLNAGSIVHLVAAIFGLTAILATSDIALIVVKWLGVTYLFYIGILAFRSKGCFLKIEKKKNIQAKGNNEIFWQGFWVDLLNPKIAIFYLAFLPQFVSLKGMHPTLQLLILGITVNVVGFLGGVILVCFAAKVTKIFFRSNDGSTLQLTWANRVMGSIFFALAARLAAEQII